MAKSNVAVTIAKIGCLFTSIVFWILSALTLILYFEQGPISDRVINLILGLSLILLGGFKLTGYFSKDLYRLAFQYDLEFGIFLVSLGILILIKAENGIRLPSAIFGLMILLDGIFKIKIAYDAKKFGIEPWLLITIIAAITSITGFAMVVSSMEIVQHVVFAVSLFIEGGLNLLMMLSTVKIINHQIPD